LSYYATVQRVAGNHNMAATRMHNFLVATTKLAEGDLRAAGEVTHETRSLLALFNVGRVICHTSIANGCPTAIHDTDNDAVLGRYIRLSSTPVVFSQRLVTLTLPPDLEKPMLWPDDYAPYASHARINAIDAALHRFLEVEVLDLPNRKARAIAVRERPLASNVSGTGIPWHPVIADYAVGLDTVKLRVEADAPGYVQLSHPWLPSTKVAVNGAVIEPLRGTIEMMVVPIQQGISVIELHEGWTTIRWISALLSVSGVIAILVTAATLGWHDRLRRAADLAREA